MNIGYACLTVGVPDTAQRSCFTQNASEEKLLEIIGHNLNSLEKIIDYNIRSDIRLFRISSGLIPFGSSSVNKLEWWVIFACRFQQISEKIRQNKIRVSMHPGQYTVLNSPDEDVVLRSIADLNYHTKVLQCLGVGVEHKIVLHIGGVYNDKRQAVKRFIANYNRLDEGVKSRLVLENDDKSYNICDVLEIAFTLGVPVIYDNLHNYINPCDKKGSDSYWINECKKTWKTGDGSQKIHYSQQAYEKKPGSHSESIRIDEFMAFYGSLDSKDIDVMLEVKDKNLSAVKCINCTSGNKTIKALEDEWSRYKYSVLERSPSNYKDIRKLLGNKGDYPAVPFYNLLEDAFRKEYMTGNSVNAALHVWGYFKETATVNEKNVFLKGIEDYKQGRTPIGAIKSILWKMTVKYRQPYLVNSLYFFL